MEAMQVVRLLHMPGLTGLLENVLCAEAILLLCRQHGAPAESLLRAQRLQPHHHSALHRDGDAERPCGHLCQAQH